MQTKFIPRQLFRVLPLLVCVQSAWAAVPSADQTGSVLLYPYYTVNGGNDTLMSVTNASTQVKAVKLRFYDGKNGREVLDFNLFLSPFDVWTAALSKNAAGGVTLTTNDKSCTVPTIGVSGVDFRNTFFSEKDANGNNIDRSISRTTEGHFEVIEMGNVVHETVRLGVTQVHGLPPKCAAATVMYINSTTLNPAYTEVVNVPSGDLFGSATIVNVAQGMSSGYDAVALDAVFSTSQHSAPGASRSSFVNALPYAGVQYKDNYYVAEFDNSDKLGGARAVSAALMRSVVLGEFIVEPALNAGIDWVLTMPTKQSFTRDCGIKAIPPFINNGFCPNGAPEVIAPENDDLYLKPKFYDQEARTNSTTLDFGTMPYIAPVALNWATTVVTINNTKVLGSSLSANWRAPGGIGSAGWIWVDLTSSTINATRSLTSLPNAQKNGKACGTLKLKGLPVIGLMFNRFANGNVGGVLSNYGNSLPLKYERNISCTTN
jgi:hypothetical protein